MSLAERLRARILGNAQVFRQAKAAVVADAHRVVAQSRRGTGRPCLLFDGSDLTPAELAEARVVVKNYRGGRATVETTPVRTRRTVIIQTSTLPHLHAEVRLALERAVDSMGGVKVLASPTFLTGKADGGVGQLKLSIADTARGLFEPPAVVRRPQDIATVLAALTEDNIYNTCWHEQARVATGRFVTQTGTGTLALGLINMKLVIEQIAPRAGDGRAAVPQELLDSTSVLTWAGKDSQPHLCFWQCLARALDPNKEQSTRAYVALAKDLYWQFYGHPYVAKRARDFNIDDLALVASMQFNVAGVAVQGAHFYVHAYALVDGKRVLRTLKRPTVLEDFHDLLWHADHIMFITNMAALTHQYECSHCKRLSATHADSRRHEETCKRPPTTTIPKKTYAYGSKRMNALLRYSYKSGVRLSAEQPWLPADAEPAGGADWFFPWAVTIDCESFLQPQAPTGRQFVHAHTLACVVLSAHPDLGLPTGRYMVTDYPSVDALMEAVVLTFLNPAQAALVRLADKKWGTFKDKVLARLRNHYAVRAAVMQDWQRAKLLKKHPNKTVEEVFERKCEAAVEALKDYMYCLPVLAHNASGYDNNVLFKEGLLQPLLAYERARGTAEPIKHVINDGAFGYKELRLERFVFLDSMHYTGPTTLAKFCDEQLGKETKLFFPYQSLTSIDVLRTRTTPPTKDEFMSDLSGSNVMAVDDAPAGASKTVLAKVEKEKKEAAKNWLLFQKQWDAAVQRMPARPWCALLEDYCVADTEPFRDAWLVFQQKFWDLYKCVLTKDAVGIPGIAEKIMTEMANDAVLARFPPDVFPEPDGGYVLPSAEEFAKRNAGYAEQDKKRRVEAPLTVEEDTAVFHRQKGCCMYCRSPCGAAWVFDRYDCERGHGGNVCLACSDCNSARKAGSPYLYWREHCLRLHSDELLCVLGTDSDESGDRFRANTEMRASIVGGFSGWYNGLLQAGEARPPSVVWTDDGYKQVPCKGIIQTIWGGDMVNLYPSTFYFDAPCGAGDIEFFADDRTEDCLRHLNEDGYLDILKCSVRVPPALRTRFSQWAPIYKTGAVSWDMLSPVQKAREQANNPDRKDWTTWSETKLVQVLEADAQWFDGYTLAWYLEQGMEVSCVSARQRFRAVPVFKPFVETISARRCEAMTAVPVRKADGNLQKLIANSSWGRFCMNPKNYLSSCTPVLDEASVYKHINDYEFMKRDIFECGEHNDPIHVVHKRSEDIKEAVPTHMGFYVLQMSKLRMLKFIYDFLFRYIDPERIVVGGTDTDALYCGLCLDEPLDMERMCPDSPTFDPEYFRSRNDLRTYVRPELLEAYDAEVACVEQAEGDKRLIRMGYDPAKHTWKELDAKQRYTPGYMCQEWVGSEYRMLNSKVYKKTDWDGVSAAKAKGCKAKLLPANAYKDVQEQGVVVKQTYQRLVVNPDTRAMATESISKVALTNRYTKGWLFEDGLQVAPFVRLQ